MAARPFLALAVLALASCSSADEVAEDVGVEEKPAAEATAEATAGPAKAVKVREETKLFLNRSSMDDPGRLADFAANLTTADGLELQRILEAFDVRKRIDMVLVLLKKELEVSRLQSKITKSIEEKVSAQQREFFLREQLKAIQRELGEEAGPDEQVEALRRRLLDREPPAPVGLRAGAAVVRAASRRAHGQRHRHPARHDEPVADLRREQPLRLGGARARRR